MTAARTQVFAHAEGDLADLEKAFEGFYAGWGFYFPGSPSVAPGPATVTSLSRAAERPTLISPQHPSSPIRTRRRPSRFEPRPAHFGDGA